MLMRALLLAGGFGTRLRPLTDTIPKCLVPIRGRSLLDYWLELLFAARIERVLINTHYMADKVASHVAQSRWRDRIDLVHESELLGTGGTILANRDWLRDGTFLVAHADNLTDFDPDSFAAAHARRPSAAIMTMLAFRTDDPRSCGILECGPDSLLTGFHEKVEEPPGNLANGAVYAMEPEVFDLLAACGRRFIDLSTEILPRLMGRIAVFEHTGYHRDIGTPASLQRAELEFVHRPRSPVDDRLSDAESPVTVSRKALKDGAVL